MILKLYNGHTNQPYGAMSYSQFAVLVNNWTPAMQQAANEVLATDHWVAFRSDQTLVGENLSIKKRLKIHLKKQIKLLAA
jgi:hypothetical protein